MPKNTDNRSLPKATDRCKDFAPILAAVAVAKGRKDGFVRIPRSFLTEVAPLLTEGDLKSALAVYVETVGRAKESNAVTLGRLQTLTGMPRRSVTRCVDRLARAGVITRGRDLTAPIRRKQATIYAPAILPDYEKPNRDTTDPIKAPHRDARDPIHRDTPDPIIGTPETPSLEGSLEHVESSSVPEQTGTTEADRTMIAFISENLKTFFSERGYRLPSGQMPLSEMAAALRGASAEQEDFAAFLTKYGTRLKSPPATWDHVASSLTNWLSEDLTRKDIAIRAALRRDMELHAQTCNGAKFHNYHGKVLGKDRVIVAAHACCDCQKGRELTPDALKAIIEAKVASDPKYISEADRLGKPEYACASCWDNGTLMKGKGFCTCEKGEQVRRKHEEEAERMALYREQSMEYDLLTGGRSTPAASVKFTCSDPEDRESILKELRQRPQPKPQASPIARKGMHSAADVLAETMASGAPW